MYDRDNIHAHAGGPRKSALIISDNALDSPHRVMLTGMGTALGVAPTALNFPDQLVNSPSAPAPVTLTNLGTAPLHIWTTAITGSHSADFGKVNGCPIPPATLAGGASCPINVTFTPSALGARTASLQISHDGGASPHAVALTGSGIGGMLAPGTDSSSDARAQTRVAPSRPSKKPLVPRRPRP